jgi:hypothetical protein
MSSTFVELGAIVLAAFGLGLFVGWLAWSTVPVDASMVTDPAPVRNPASDANPKNEPADTDDETLPQWWAERVPTAELQLRTRRFRPGNRGPTVVVRPRGWSQTGRG